MKCEVLGCKGCKNGNRCFDQNHQQIINPLELNSHISSDTDGQKNKIQIYFYCVFILVEV